VAGEVKYRDAIPIRFRLKRLNDLLRRGVGQRYDFADPFVLRRLERGDDIATLELEAAEMARARIFIRGRDENDGGTSLTVRRPGAGL
jgi:hypothetical protein